MDIRKIFKKKEKNKLLLNWKIKGVLQESNVDDLIQKCSKKMPPYWGKLTEDFDLEKTIKLEKFIPVKNSPHDKDREYFLENWKKKNGFSRANASTCPSFNEIFKNSYILKTPVDLYVEIDKKGIIVTSSNSDIIDVANHDLQTQLWGGFNPNLLNVKFEIFGVMAKTLNKSSKIIMLDNIYYSDLPFRVMPGILPLSPKYPVSFNLNTTIDRRFFNLEEKYTKLIKSGTPLAMFYMPDGVLDIKIQEIPQPNKKYFIADHMKKLNEK